MKYKMLLLSKSPSTSIGLRSYLNNIFGQYIDLEACLTDLVSTALLKRFDLVLFASGIAAREAEPFMTPEIPSLRCIRTFNYTYLYRILSIPAGSEVYLVNDTRHNAEMAVEKLKQVGITQYHFVPYYPGAQEADPPLHYAVTLGESRLVPKSIPNVVDIGVRVADISTISEIVSFFGLPMSLVDEVTKNFISQYVQLLKVSNHRLSQANNSKFITQSIISNIGAGVCVLNSRGVIAMVNRPFMEMLSMEKIRPVGMPIAEAAPELAKKLEEKRRLGEPGLQFFGGGGRSLVTLTFQEIEDSGHEKLLMIHGSERSSLDMEEKKEEKRDGASRKSFCHFNDYQTVNEKTKNMLGIAKRISLTNFRLLIEGERGTGKHMLAQAVHNNSDRCLEPFLRLHLTAMSEEQFLEEVEKICGGLPTEGKGTLYLDGVHSLSEPLQREVLRLLDQENGPRIISSSNVSLYGLCQEGKFLPELFYRLSEASLSTIPVRQRPEDIPVLFEYFLRNSYNNPALAWSDLFSEGLCCSLTNYQWPGNVKEIANLCKYFYCIRTNNRLYSRDLPPYILEQLREKRDRLTPLERELLAFISQNPKIGRAKLYELLRERGIEVGEGKIRSLLASMAERGMIRTNRTKGGCEITEEGEILL